MTKFNSKPTKILKSVYVSSCPVMGAWLPHIWENFDVQLWLFNAVILFSSLGSAARALVPCSCTAVFQCLVFSAMTDPAISSGFLVALQLLPLSHSALFLSSL